MWEKKWNYENLKATIHNKDYDRSNQLESIEYSNYLGIMTQMTQNVYWN